MKLVKGGTLTDPVELSEYVDGWYWNSFYSRSPIALCIISQLDKANQGQKILIFEKSHPHFLRRRLLNKSSDKNGWQLLLLIIMQWY